MLSFALLTTSHQRRVARLFVDEQMDGERREIRTHRGTNGVAGGEVNERKIEECDDLPATFR